MGIDEMYCFLRIVSGISIRSSLIFFSFSPSIGQFVISNIQYLKNVCEKEIVMKFLVF